MTDIDMAAIEILAEQYRQARDEANKAAAKKERLGEKLKRFMVANGVEVDCPTGRGKFSLDRRRGRIVLDNEEAAVDAGYAHRGDDVVALIWKEWSDDEWQQYLSAIRRGVA